MKKYLDELFRVRMILLLRNSQMNSWNVSCDKTVSLTANFFEMQNEYTLLRSSLFSLHVFQTIVQTYTSPEKHFLLSFLV